MCFAKREPIIIMRIRSLNRVLGYFPSRWLFFLSYQCATYLALLLVLPYLYFDHILYRNLSHSFWILLVAEQQGLLTTKIMVFNKLPVNFKTVDWSISRSVGQLVSRSVGPSVRRSVGQLVSRSVGQSVRRSVGQSVIQSDSAMVSQTVSCPVVLLASQSVSQSVNRQSARPPVSQSVDPSVS